MAMNHITTVGTTATPLRLKYYYVTDYLLITPSLVPQTYC